MLNRKINPEAWTAFLDGLSKRLRRGTARPFARLHVVVPGLAGTQPVVHWQRLEGASYDRRDHALYLFFEGLTHRAARPEVIWAAVDSGGEVEELLVRGQDGYRYAVELSAHPLAYGFADDENRSGLVRGGAFRAARDWWERVTRRRGRPAAAEQETYAWPPLPGKPSEAFPAEPVPSLVMEEEESTMPPDPVATTCCYVAERYEVETPG